jgi:hypothetical protein
VTAVVLGNLSHITDGH